MIALQISRVHRIILVLLVVGLLALLYTGYANNGFMHSTTRTVGDESGQSTSPLVASPNASAIQQAVPVGVSEALNTMPDIADKSMIYNSFYMIWQQNRSKRVRGRIAQSSEIYGWPNLSACITHEQCF